MRRSIATSVFFFSLAAVACGGGPVASPVEGQNPTGGINAERWQDTDPVILISFDGFRWDYMERWEPPAILSVAQRGVHVENGSMPPFPSKTFPSHYSLATGLWSENHELVGNSFWDPGRNDGYTLRDRSAVEDGSWYSGEPIWVTAETQGMVAASFFFVGSEADVGGVRPSEWFRYDGSIPGDVRVDTVLSWLRRPAETRPRVITLYFSDVDDAGHSYGPYADETRDAVLTVDGHLQRLLDGLAEIEGGDRVTLLLASDHGMHENDPDRAWTVDVRSEQGVRFVEGGPYGSFMVEGDDARKAEVRDLIAGQLPDEVGVYLREDVPEYLHYSATPRVGDVVVVVPLGANIIRPGARAPTGFTHGWDPTHPEMHALFVGMGPRLRPGSTLERIRHVDVYPLMAELLGLRPAVVDGALSAWDGVLIERR